MPRDIRCLRPRCACVYVCEGRESASRQRKGEDGGRGEGGGREGKGKEEKRGREARKRSEEGACAVGGWALYAGVVSQYSLVSLRRLRVSPHECTARGRISYRYAHARVRAWLEGSARMWTHREHAHVDTLLS